MTTLRVGLFSLDHMHALNYLRCLQELPDVTVVGLWHQDGTLGRKTARQHATRYFADAARLRAAGLDAAVVCSANADHPRDVKPLAAAGIPTLCEKPLGATLAQAHSVVEFYARSPAFLMTAFPCRFVPTVIRAREMIRQGELGTIQSIVATNRGTYPGGWFAERKKAGGGAIIDHTVHVVDLLRWILGTEVATVFAESSRRLRQGKVEDTGLLMMTLTDGAAASLDTSWSRNAARYPTWGDVTLEFIGSRGVLSVDAFAQVAELYSNQRPKGELIPFGDSADALMIEAFIGAVRGGGPPPVTVADGLRAVEVAAGAYESLRSGKVKRLRRTRPA